MLKSFLAFLIGTGLVLSAPAREISPDRVLEIYAKYLTGGRSDTEVQISVRGEKGAARVGQTASGTFMCVVRGLGTPEKDLERPEQSLVETGKVIHEITHCLHVPYLDIAGCNEQAMPEVRVANDLRCLAAEMVADARALIEIARRDGMASAERYAAVMIPFRSRTTKLPNGDEFVTHTTALALLQTLEVLRREDARTWDDSSAFTRAIETGRLAAEQAMRQKLSPAGAEYLMYSDDVVGALAEIDEAGRRAIHSFTGGTFTNNRATIRFADGVRTPKDFHFTVLANGEIVRQETLGLEGAFGQDALREFIASSDEPAHLLAVETMRKLGRLDIDGIVTARDFFRFAASSNDPTHVLAVDAMVKQSRFDIDGVKGVKGVFDRQLNGFVKDTRDHPAAIAGMRAVIDAHEPQYSLDMLFDETGRYLMFGYSK